MSPPPPLAVLAFNTKGTLRRGGCKEALCQLAFL